jgi:dipeptidyl aminopeptidase/acylaminoacyl peptidase
MKKLLLLCFLAISASARPITEKDIFAFKWIADPQISPDGSQVAYTLVTVDEKNDRYQTAIWTVATTPGSAPRRLTNGPGDASPRWSHDGKMLAFVRAGEREGRPQPGQIWVLRFDGGEPHAITSLRRGVSSINWSPVRNAIAFTVSTKPDDIGEEKKSDEHVSDVRIINQAVYRANGAGYNDTERRSHVWVIDVSDAGNDKPKQLTTGNFSEGDVDWSPDGSRIYFTSERVNETYYDVRTNALYSIPATGGDMTKVASYDGAIGSYAISPDGSSVAFVGSMAHPVQSHTESDLFIVSTTPGSQARNVTKTYDIEMLNGGVGGDQAPPRGGRGPRPMWSNDGKTLLMSTANEGTVNLSRVDVSSGKFTAWTQGKHTIGSYDIAGGKTVALMSTPTMLGDLFNVANDGTLTRLTNVNEKLWGELTLTEPEEIWYSSFDGKKIEGWLQRPPDFDPSKKYPLIINIHGGPHSAYGYIFDHEFQWMAAKGYVVLYPNPRGSTTYGEGFANIIQYHYPGDDYKDLMAGVDAAIAKGYVDPKKLGVTGGSGGGLLTDWVIGQTDRFAAAVAQRDIADWSNFWYVADFTLFQPTWFRKAPWEDPEDFKARSPITYIERVKTPLMLILGEADWRTPPMAGGEMMFRALKYRHIPTVMVRFPDESHELSRSGKPWHRVERLQNIVNWFDKWLMGKPMPQYDAGLRNTD